MEVDSVDNFTIIERKDYFGLVYKYIKLQYTSKEQVDKLLSLKGFKINGQSILIVPDLKDVSRITIFFKQYRSLLLK